jgi:hypothetical protein
MQSRAGRELDYQHRDKDMLVASLMQAEDDIRSLKADLVGLEEERDQYLRESRDSAMILGGIVRLLRDREWMAEWDVPSSPSGHGVRPRQLHRLSRDGALGGVCVCGQQWLISADRCVTQA